LTTYRSNLDSITNKKNNTNNTTNKNNSTSTVNVNKTLNRVNTQKLLNKDLEKPKTERIDLSRKGSKLFLGKIKLILENEINKEEKHHLRSNSRKATVNNNNNNNQYNIPQRFYSPRTVNNSRKKDDFNLQNENLPSINPITTTTRPMKKIKFEINNIFDLATQYFQEDQEVKNKIDNLLQNIVDIKNVLKQKSKSRSKISSSPSSTKYHGLGNSNNELNNRIKILLQITVNIWWG
jgi:hypothetical protein